MKKKNKSGILIITIGVIGLISGILLLINGEKLLGFFGSIASSGIAIKAISDLRKDNK